MLEWSFPSFWPDASNKAKQFYNRIFKPTAPPQYQPAPQQPVPYQPEPQQPVPYQPMPSQAVPQNTEELLRYIEEVHQITGQILALLRGTTQQPEQPTQEGAPQQKRICFYRRVEPL